MANAQLELKYARMLRNFMPKGLAWNYEKDSELSKLINGFSIEPSRVECEGFRLIQEAFPDTTNELLPEWESVLGLPDECTAEQLTFEERRIQVVQKLTRLGGQNAAFYIGLADLFGFPGSKVFDLFPSVSGRLRSGDRLNAHPDFRFTWEFNSPPSTIKECRSGACRSGDRLRAFGNETLQCTIEKLKPAQTFVIFTFQT